MKPIPQEWIKTYVDALLEAAKSFGPDSLMDHAVLKQADAIMHMVEAFQL